jgi:glucose-1-phosphate thymidylyltransferase
LKIACPKEITNQKRWITPEQLGAIADKYAKNSYGEYLWKLLRQVP